MLGRTRDLQSFEITHFRLLVTRALAFDQSDSRFIEQAGQWEIWGHPPANTSPVAIAGSDQALVGAGS